MVCLQDFLWFYKHDFISSTFRQCAEPPAQRIQIQSTALHTKNRFIERLYFMALFLWKTDNVKGQYGARGQGVQEYEHLWLSTNYLKLRPVVESTTVLRLKVNCWKTLV